MCTAGEQCRKPQRKNQAFCLWDHALLSHLDVNLLDYIPHKATTVPLFLALCISHCICGASHESVLAPLSRCPQRAPAPPGILSDFRIQSSIYPGGSSVRRDLHSSNPVTRVES